jgi:hypothetical protein
MRRVPSGWIITIVCVTLFAAAGRVVSAASYVVQGSTGDLSTVTLNGSASLGAVGSAGHEFNNMGWSSVDGNLYALGLTGSGFGVGNTGLIRIDPVTGNVTQLGGPLGLPTGAASRFDAGDVFGNTMWISFGASETQTSATYRNNLYTLDLSTVTGGGNDISGTQVAVTTIFGDDAQVNDWAYNTLDGLLYGGDKLTGRLVTLDPITGQRQTFAAGLPDADVAFGAAWYDPNSQDVFLYNNAGVVYQIDPSTKSMVTSWTGQATQFNDGAYVGVVPIPAALPLFASALAVFGFMGYRRRRIGRGIEGA